jgi:c-di-GMP-binding flagellar brake protein YcgR
VDSGLQGVLERLNIDRGRIIRTTSREVNLSAAGIRFRVGEKLNIGESLQVKMVLPTIPAVGVIADGTVLRVKDSDDGTFEIALGFSEMDEEVRDEIIRYALGRQREFIRKKRRQGT